MNLIDTLKSDFHAFLVAQFGDHALFDSMEFVLNSDPGRQEFGDINCNVALLLAKPLGKAPRQIAQQIADTFVHPDVQKIQTAGPGFLNFFLTLALLQKTAQELFTQKNGFFKTEKPKGTYNIEFVSANPTGPLHLGHGRGGIIGDVLARILSFLGYPVCREHYINDAGAQMVRLGQSLKIRCQQILGQDVLLPEDGYQGEYLKALAQQCISENGADVIARPETFFREYAHRHMLALLQKTVAQYNIHFDVWFSEMTLHPDKINEALEIMKRNGHLYQEGGAWWFKSTAFGDDKDRVLKKADGEFTYAAADAAYLLDKAQRGFDHLIIVLGQDHHSYPKRLEGMRQALGLTNVKLECIIYQLVSIKEDGQQLKLSKRAGRIVGLADIIEEVGVDCARFFYLNKKADAHLDFDLSLALSHTDDNPVYYLQYAAVRTKSIWVRAQENPAFASIGAADAAYLTAGETLLIKKISALKPLLTDIASHYQVHLLAYYLLEVAHLFHNYYHHNRVIEPESVEQSRARLLLTVLVKEQFERCLELMGLSCPENM